MNLDSIIAEIEKDAVQWGSNQYCTAGPCLMVYSNRRSSCMFLSKIVKMIVDGIDLVAYYKSTRP